MIYSDILECIKSMTIIVDTREQKTNEFDTRINQFNCPIVRSTLNFGDYSAFVKLPNGEIFSLADKVVIERKMDFEELCKCYTSQRERFTKEFDRAMEANAKIYLLVEKASWEKAYRGAYKSNMSSKSLIGSMTTWLARYNCQIVFCDTYTTGILIYDILSHEMREALRKVYVPMQRITKY